MTATVHTLPIADGYTAQILAQMEAAGIETPPEQIIANGRLHRFASAAGRKEVTGWYVVHDDPVSPVWMFGDWRLGIKETGHGDPGRKLSAKEIAARKKRVARAAEEAAREEQAIHVRAAEDAMARWNACPPALDTHEYLKRKGVTAHGLRIDNSALLVPMYDISGKLWSIQEIWPDGHKSNQTGGRRKGCFFTIGKIDKDTEIFAIAEGFATAAAIHEAIGFAPVVSAGDACNMEAVAIALRAKHEGAVIIICGDDDWMTKVGGKPRNVGRIAAEKAAKAVDGVLAMPWFNESSRPKWATDFNDQAKLYGFSEVGTTIDLAITAYEEAAQNSTPNDGVSLDDFFAYMPMANFIFAPSREMWPAQSINARFPKIEVRNDAGETFDLKPSVWLAKNRPVEQMTWMPGEPMLIKDRLVTLGGWIDKAGATCFNQYRAPTLKRGDANMAGKWIEHVRRVYPDDADHIVRWLAQRVQRPDMKINHALVLGGNPGIGKDSLIEPARQAVGPWNVAEVTPAQVLGRFNGFVKSVIMRVNEARDLGEFDRFELYEKMKLYTAAPPDTLRIDEKNIKEYYVPNVTGTIITTNHKLDGIYLAPDDRRHYVAWSDLVKEDFEDGYWNDLWNWYDAGGVEHVAAYLATLDLSEFDPKAPPKNTDAFWAIVGANHAPEDAELADTLDRIARPDVVTLAMIRAAAEGPLVEWLNNRGNTRAIPHRLDRCGYEAVRNTGAKDGLWVLSGKRQVIYTRREIPTPRRHNLVSGFVTERRYQN